MYSASFKGLEVSDVELWSILLFLDFPWMEENVSTRSNHIQAKDHEKTYVVMRSFYSRV